MKIRFEREEVEEIVMDYAINKFNLNVFGKLCTMTGYYGGMGIEITDKEEGEKF